MKPILEYIISKSSKRYVIKATDNTIKNIVKDELDRLGHDANLNHIDVSEVTNMRSVFDRNRKDFGWNTHADINPDISEWDVSKVITMENMFWDCIKFNGDISEWITSNVKNTNSMFYSCKKFNCDISKLDMGSVESMSCMFQECKKFNQDLSCWDVSNVTNDWMTFKNCPIKEEYKPKFNK